MLQGISREPEAREQFAPTQHVALELVGCMTTDDDTQGI